jgi:cathepsin L
MKAIVVLVALAAVASAARTDASYRADFMRFIREHGKSYSSAEFQHRFMIFKANLDFVDAWNTKGFHTVAINKFADLTASEFGALYTGTRISVEEPAYTGGAPTDLPASVDWRTQGAVTGIKDQGQCGSCWAFSTTGSTEGAHFLKTGSLVSLSEQNLVDCSKKEGNQGCNGGLMTQAMDYIIKNNGIDTEASYPYHASTGLFCHFKAANVGATLSSYTNVQSGNESDLQAKAVEGPVSVAIDASHTSFQLYSTGVYYEPACSSTQYGVPLLSVP